MDQSRKPQIYDCAIIGAGPGGLVSALYLARYKRQIALIDAGHSRAQWIPKIRNLIGAGKGLSGMELLRRLRDQVQQYPCDWIRGEAEVLKKNKIFEIRIGKRKLRAKYVILAIGMKDIQPNFSNIPALRKKAVLVYCPICDGYEHSDQTVGLIVQDNKGFHKIQFLSQYSKRVEVFCTKKFRLSEKNKKLASQLKVPVHTGIVQGFKIQTKPKALLIQVSGQRSMSCVDVAYIALGVDINQKVTRNLKALRRTGDGHIRTGDHQETSIPGLYAVGDCVNALAQVSVAIGQAALAATRIHNLLPFPKKN
jgi:thioredoxin reductase (NADPH)